MGVVALACKWISKAILVYCNQDGFVGPEGVLGSPLEASKGRRLGSVELVGPNKLYS